MRREIFEPLGLDGCRVGEFSRAEAGSVAQPHWHDGERSLPMRQDPPIVPAITSAAAGGIRCGLDDMLAWAMNWLAPTPAQLQWLGPEQRAEMWKPRTPMPLSKFRRDMDGTTHYDYAFGFRLADGDGQENGSPHRHPGGAVCGAAVSASSSLGSAGVAPSEFEALKAEQARMAGEIAELRALVTRMARELGIEEG